MSGLEDTVTEKAPRGGDKTLRVYDHVMERIVDGTLPAGAPLNIGAIAEETGVSLIPTREALRRLESEGLVEFLFHRGVRVAALGIDEYREIMQTQAVLEALAVGMSAPRLTAEDLDRARAVNARMDAAVRSGDFHAYNEGSLEFHGILRSHCPNQHLRDMLDRGESRVAAVRASVVGYRGAVAQRLSDEHGHMLERIAEGADAAEIEALMRAHREGTIAADSEGLRRSTEQSGDAPPAPVESLEPA